MSVRKSRRFRTSSPGNDVGYWPSMVDIMSSTAMILFFVMTVIATLSFYRSMTYQKIADKNETLLSEQETLISELDHQKEENLKLLTDIELIITKREGLYDALMIRLNSQLGEGKVKKDGTRLYVDAETLFEYNQWVLKDEGKTLAAAMGAAFYQIILEQQNASGDTNSFSTKIASIEVIGHADNLGTASGNRLVSSERSGVFVDYMLSALDVDAVNQFGSYFKSSSMSMYAPVAGTVDAQTTEDREKNRRIEFVINFSDNDLAYLLDIYGSGAK